MATRVNTRFILLLFVVTSTVVGLAGGIWFINWKGDATRNIAAGDEYFAAGDYEKAMNYYGRAVNKEPDNLGFVDKVEDALLRIHPSTQDQANELDVMRFEILRRRVRYLPGDADVHLTLLRELHQMCRFFGQGWQDLIEAAEEMDHQVAPDDPTHAYARLYRGMARTRTMSLGSDSEDEIARAQEDLTAFVQAVPGSDLGWATLIRARLTFADQLKNARQTRSADAAFVRLEDARRQALQAVPDGPEVAAVNALCMAYKLQGTVEPDEAFIQEVQRMVDLAGASDDPLLLSEVVGLLRAADRTGGRDRAVELLRQHLTEHPEALFHRYLLAQLFLYGDQLDESYAEAERVITAAPVSVSLLSRLQAVLQVRAAALAVDVELRRWEVLDDRAAKNDQFTRVQSARDRLAALVPEPDKEPALLQADGRIAFAKGDYQTAARRFESALELVGGDNFELLWFSSLALERRGESGLALERMEQALENRPNSVDVLYKVAQLQAAVGRYDQADEALLRLRGLDPKNQAAAKLSQVIAIQRAGSNVDADDPVAQDLAVSRLAVEDGDFAGARAALLRALKAAPDNLLVLGHLVDVEVRAGEDAQALSYLEEALRIDPKNSYLQSMEIALKSPDRVEAIKQHLAAIYPDNGDRLVFTGVQLDRLAQLYDEDAARDEKAGKAERASRLRADAQRARAEGEAMLAQADQEAPNHPVLLEYRFSTLIDRKEFDAARRVADRAAAVNADEASGLVFKGRLELANGQFAEAAKTFTEATARKAYASLPWRLLGRSQEGLGNLAEAREAYRQAYRRNPNDTFAVRWYVNLLVRTGDRAKSLQVLREAPEAVKSDPVLQDLWLQMEATEGDLTLALKTRRDRYQRAPEDRVNVMQLAALLSEATPTWEQVTDAAGKPLYDGQRWSLLPSADRADHIKRVRTSWIAESQRILAALEAGGEPSLGMALLRAQLQRSQGDIDGGVAALSRYAQSVTEKPRRAEASIALGIFQASCGRFDDGVASVTSARADQGADTREADRALASLYFERGRWAETFRVLGGLTGPSADRQVRLQMIECQIKLGRFEDARIALDAADAESRDFTTEMLSAALARGLGDALREQGNDAQAVAEFDRERDALAQAARLDPTSPLPHLQKARGLVNEFRATGTAAHLDEALLALTRADEVTAGMDATSLMRIEVLSARRDMRGALGEAGRMVERNPANVETRGRLIEMLAMDGQLDAALEVVAEGAALAPTDARWPDARGEIEVLRSTTAKTAEAAHAALQAAANAFTEAWTLDPSPKRLSKLADVLMALPKPDFEEVIRALIRDEGVLENAPILRSLYARALDGVGRRAEALGQMRKAYTEFEQQIADGAMNATEREAWYRTLRFLYPSQGVADADEFAQEVSEGDLDVWELHWLAEMYMGLLPDGLNRALELQRLAVARCTGNDAPLRPQALYDLGTYLLTGGDFQAAADAFEEVVALNRRHTIALNNLAFLYAQYLGDPARALPYAKRAVTLAPDSPDVLDTVGWTHFKLGELEPAERYLREAVTVGPQASNLIHLVRVLIDRGNLTGARTYLERAAEMKPDPAEREEIQRLSDEINGTRN